MTTTAKQPAATRAARPAARRPAQKKGLLHYIGVGLSFGLLALVLVLAVMVVALPMLTKSTPFTVLTSSMTPSYPAGTLVIVKPTDPQQIRIGDQVRSARSRHPPRHPDRGTGQGRRHREVHHQG
jgi:signal peptidase